MEVVNARAKRLQALMAIAKAMRNDGCIDSEIKAKLEATCIELWQLSRMSISDYIKTVMTGLDIK